MRIEIIAIGNELLVGMTVNTNAFFISQQLVSHGFSPTCHEVVPDDKREITKSITKSLERSSLVIVTGGLGPTCDDITKQVLCQIFDVPLVSDPEVARILQKRFGKDFPTIENQSLMPKGALPLENTIGTAFGIIFQNQKKHPKSHLIALPGVPLEMHEMFLKKALPFIKTVFNKEKRLHTQTLHLFSVTENDADVVLRRLQKKYPDVVYGIYPAYGTLTLLFSAADEKIVQLVKKEIKKRFSQRTYTSSSGTLTEALHNAFIKKKQTIACAESCTGGLLSAEFVTFPGASKYFLGSVVAYSNDVKINILGIKKFLVEKHGAVSREVVEAMSEQIRKKLKADIGVATSGIFGPTGGTKEKPVGTVWAAISSKKQTKSFCWHIEGNREFIRARTLKLIQCELMLALQETKNE